MVNSIKEVDQYLSDGANAIETDVHFESNGTAVSVHHGCPCDFFRNCNKREELTEYLTYLRLVTTPDDAKFKPNLAVLFLDLKLAHLPANVKLLAGHDLAKKIITYVFQEGMTKSRIKLLFSIGNVIDREFVIGFYQELESRNLDQLKEKIGWDVGLNDELDDIDSMWQIIEEVENHWQGDGITNWISPLTSHVRLKDAVHRRDEADNSYIAKVYHWTIDLALQQRKSLRIGVDGIITNFPRQLLNVLQEDEFANEFRLATYDDNPWERIQAT